MTPQNYFSTETWLISLELSSVYSYNSSDPVQQQLGHINIAGVGNVAVVRRYTYHRGDGGWLTWTCGKCLIRSSFSFLSLFSNEVWKHYRCHVYVSGRRHMARVCVDTCSPAALAHVGSAANFIPLCCSGKATPVYSFVLPLFRPADTTYCTYSTFLKIQHMSSTASEKLFNWQRFYKPIKWSAS